MKKGKQSAIQFSNEAMQKMLDEKSNAIAQLNRELKIETSLQRVRAIAMGMKEPADMLKVCKTISLQLQSLGVKEIRNVQTAIFYESRGTYMNYEYYAKHKKTVITETIYTNHKVPRAFAKKMLQGKGEIFITHIKGQKVKDWLAYQKTTNVFIDRFLEKASSLNYYWHSLGPVALGISTYVPLNKEDLNLFNRFLKVFELAYTRYLDIEQAIAQAREAKIEASLEKVRAQALGMRKPENLPNVCEVLFKELRSLGFGELRNAMVNIHNDTNRTFVNYDYSDEIGKSITPLFYDIHPVIKKQIKKIRSADDAFSETVFKGKDLENWKAFRKSRGEKEDKRIKNSTALYYYFYSIGTGSIGISAFDAISKEKLDVLKRFRNVFAFAYRRYMDVAQAEAQAREAKIEAALERTRTQSMIMQHSNELDDTLRVFHQQVLLLGIDSAFSFLWLPDEEKDRHIFWAAWAENNSTVFKSKAINYPLDRNEPATAQCLVDWKSNQPVVSYHVPPNGVENYFAAWSELIVGVEQLKPEYFSDGLYYVEAFIKYGCFGVMVKIELAEEEKKILYRFAIEFERAYTRFLDLQKAEAQARESQIQLALERVRARTMAMQKSDELPDAALLLSTQVKELGVQLWSTSFQPWDNDRKAVTAWTALKDIMLEPIKIPATEDSLMINISDAAKKGELLYVEEMSGKVLENHLKYMNSLPGVKEEFGKVVDAGFSFPTFNIFHAAYFSTGFILFITEKPYPEAHDIFKRFAKVFEQTYTRFLDLQKAEAQAREAQIETALERVRSKTMAMHKSEELLEVINTVSEQLEHLQFRFHNVSFVINNMEYDLDYWLASPGQSHPFRIHVPYLDNPIITRFRDARNKGISFFADVLTREENLHWIKHMLENSVLKNIPDSDKQYLMSRQGFARSVVLTNHITLVIGNYASASYSDEQNAILRRFANVFEQSYTRFLDLQKAEAQAREAQIEASLERVRSRSMGMQNSEELKEVIKLVYQQLIHLKIHLDHAGFVVDYKPKGDWTFWIADEQDIPSKITHPYFDSVWAKQFDEAKENGTDFFVTHLNFEEKNKFYNELLSFVPGLPEATKEFYLSCPGLAATTVLFENIGLYIENFSGTPYTDEENKTLMRFGKVFQQTYTRFLDLQKAEAQAKEAQIETALEKVRSRTLAMQHSDELAETAAVVFKQLIGLGIEPNRLYIGIIKEENNEIELWATDEEGTKVSTPFTASAKKSATINKMYEGWQTKKKSMVIDLQGKDLNDYLHYLSEELHATFKVGLTQKRRVQSLAFFSQGCIGMASPEPQPQETITLLERFAAVFNLTYTRFNDLQVAEAHAIQAEEDLQKLIAEKKRTEETLKELKATQAQLIQSEKMASLGELTAGIAHEIQNPLNFVNNFSEVSSELISEMVEEVDKGNYGEVKTIAGDVKQNLDKINHHGKRAGDIVKGMLQHSRSSSGVKEPTNINALADEYLRLAYHGLRAKDKTFNAAMKTDFDESIGNINIIPQDIGRVILNLITNAFYAVQEKQIAAREVTPFEKVLPLYEPTVTITTSSFQPPSGGRSVQIKVADNGDGIPQKILDKIFQPFFTTKPAGQGTGLGLSLSYDIVKAHGGEIKVETKEGIGTHFIIQLPV